MSCSRSEHQGALFHYHTQGIKTPEGVRKLPMVCTECVDKLKIETGIPYNYVDLYMATEKTFGFYVNKVKAVGGDAEAVEDARAEILKQHIKDVDVSYHEKIEGRIDQAKYIEECTSNVKKLTGYIASVAGVPLRSISNGGTGFRKID